MFIGYNKARRSGLPKKDFLIRDHVLNPLRIRVLRSGADGSAGQQPNLGHDIMNFAAGLPSISQLERHRGEAGFAETRELSTSSERNCSCATKVRVCRSITR